MQGQIPDAATYFEHLLPATPIVAELLTTAPRVKMLVTSRAPLHIYGEREFPVPPLALPDLHSPASVEALAKNPAIALFLERAAAVKPNFKLTKINAAATASPIQSPDVPKYLPGVSCASE